MKRVTFRVPEDHEIATSMQIIRAQVTATCGEHETSVPIRQDADGTYGANSYGYYPTLDEAQTVAAACARDDLRRQVLDCKIGQFV